MAIKYGKKKNKQNSVVYTVIATILLCAVFLTMVAYIYRSAENDAYESLHVQTKQIKDDIILQLVSDQENLITMANFAAKLYNDGDDYNIMFDSFKPAGLIENIGILNPDNTFVTKAGSIDLDGRISFEEEKKKGKYISGRMQDLTKDNYEIIRTAVPINVNGEVVGVLYGVIKLDKIGQRYKKMAEELDAQLFVYNRSDGNLVIDTIQDELGNISFLKNRKYNKGYSYEQMMSTDKGFTSFLSAYSGENLHMHYSAIEEFDWMIALARYDSQVFMQTHKLFKRMLITFLAMLLIIILYILILMLNENRINSVTNCASEVRKELLETVDGQNNIFDALVVLCRFANADSAMFFDTNGDDYNYIMPKLKMKKLLKNDRQYFKTELFRYAAENYKIKKAPVSVMCIKPNRHLAKTNPSFYEFLNKQKISDISFATVVNNGNHISILGSVNSKNAQPARMLVEKIAACFSMALYNKNHITKTEVAATTDSLTGVLNRVSYKDDIAAFDAEKPANFSCVYIDVNELHLCNNKYGHAAGDEMLLYVANALKNAFGEHKIYRIGGDEFVVFAKNTEHKIIKAKFDSFVEQIKRRNYNVAAGISYREHNLNTEEIVKEAEIRMYEEKALYYQEKERKSAAKSAEKEYVRIETGILEIDTILSILNENYNGIYRVSLDTDRARRILMPAYLNYNEREEHYSSLFSRYVSEMVDPDYHRALMSFMNYSVIRRQLEDGEIPKIRYKKSNGETVVLSVYKLCEPKQEVSDTLWVFAKD